jgi:CRP-like cAMP-binding protein
MNPTLAVSPHPEPTTAQMIEVLGAVDLFDMLSDADLERVITAGELRRLYQGDYLFEAGDPPDSIHVILAGAIEVVRSTPDNPEPMPVAYLSPGEAIGDMGLFTRTRRRSAGRAPEFADILTLTITVFNDLTRSVPGYGMEIAGVFARRLEAFINHMRGQKRRKELSGKLRFFDLPTVVQTLVQSNQTGVLTITDDDGTMVAEVLLRDGSVDRARYGLMEGEEAFFQLFHNDDHGEFFFRTMREPSPDSISTIRIAMSAMNLLMDAIRRVDEFPGLRNRLPNPEGPYRAKTGELDWQEVATEAIAQEVFAKLREPRPIADLVDEVPCSVFTLYRIAAELYESDQIG